MVMALPWKPDFDMGSLKSTSALVWVDLPNLNPTFEYFANDLLKCMGKVIYAATKTTKSRFSHVKGYVLCDMSLDLVDHIVLDIEGQKEVKIEVEYMTLPNACFICKQRGHSKVLQGKQEPTEPQLVENIQPPNHSGEHQGVQRI